MNTLLYSIKYVPRVVNPIVKIGDCTTRGLKSDLKIKWVRPEKIPCIHPAKSGDLGIDYEVPSNELTTGYDKSEELKNAPDVVKKLFTLEFRPMRETAEKCREKIRRRVARYESDKKSMETRIAAMTTQILYLQQVMDKYPRNIKCRVFLKELIEKRKSHLKEVRNVDYKRFEWLLEKCNVIYKSYPETVELPARKPSLRKLTTRHCDEIRSNKLNAYRAELEGQQKGFFKEKAEKLAFIRSEEIACGLEPTVTEEEIALAQKKAAEFQ